MNRRDALHDGVRYLWMRFDGLSTVPVGSGTVINNLGKFFSLGIKTLWRDLMLYRSLIVQTCFAIDQFFISDGKCQVESLRHSLNFRHISKKKYVIRIVIIKMRFIAVTFWNFNPGNLLFIQSIGCTFYTID